MRRRITAAQAIMAGLAFMVAVLVAGPQAHAQNLTWNTFVGSTNSDYGEGIAVDASGNVYVTGISDYAWGSPVRAHAGGYDAFVAKFDSSGNLVWNTFLGSANDDRGYGIAVDGSGNVYVTGYSGATWGGPVRAHAGGEDAFAAKLNNNGALVWNTFLGSANVDWGYGIAVDGSGNVYVTGYSGSTTWGSPVRAHAGSADAFAVKLNNNGALVWNTFLGSANDDGGNGIAVDGSGNVYVTGSSNYAWGSPVRAHAGEHDAFAAKLNNNGALVWNTFLGSANIDNGRGIALDGSGNVYVTGVSYATWGSPVRAYAGAADAFAAKLNNNGVLVWNTFLGSEYVDQSVGDMAVDASGNVYVTGYSHASWGSPVRAHAGVNDAFAAKLNNNGALVWNTFLGSAVSDGGSGMAVDGSGNVYVTGQSSATWGSPLRAHAGNSDVFVAKLSASNDCVIIAGTGSITWVGDNIPATQSTLNGPQHLYVDTGGNVFIADIWNHRVRKIDTSGTIRTIAGTGEFFEGPDGGPAASTAIITPLGIKGLPNGEIYFTCFWGGKSVRKIGTDGKLRTVVGNGSQGFSGDGGLGTLAQVSLPIGLDYDRTAVLAIADHGNSRVRWHTIQDGTIWTMYSGLSTPQCLAFSKTQEATTEGTWGIDWRYIPPTAFISERDNNRILKKYRDSTTVLITGLNTPDQIAVDSSDNLYIADSGNNRIVKYTSGGVFVKQWTGFNAPRGVTVDNAGRIYVSDSGNNQIKQICSTVFYRDADGDGYGNAAVPMTACSQPSGYVTNNTDCNDSSSAARPGGTEACDGIDNDCDGLIDENVKTTYYRDADGDGYGNAAVTTQACSASAEYVANATDCNDSNAVIKPGAAEVCDGIDNDCDDIVDNCDNCYVYYRDADGDGYGDSGDFIFSTSPTPPEGYVGNNTDTDDTDPNVYPGSDPQNPVPDTGQTKCYNTAGEITCPQPGVAFYGQDAEYVKARSYTDLGNGIVRDNVTGLEWVKDGNLMATRNPEFDNDDGPGDGQVTWQHALDYVAKLNTDKYLDHDDWRLPTVQELSSIVDISRTYPTIDPVFSAEASDYWSSTTVADYINDAWYVDFSDYGYVDSDYMAYGHYVRAVRSGQSESLDNLVINGDGTITDTATGLMWEASASYFSTWRQALDYCENIDLAGYTDWRLPDRNELQSIVDYSRYSPAIDPVFSAVVYDYWSSTTHADFTFSAWVVYFDSGDVGARGKTSYSFVRAVRSGQYVLSGDLGTLCIEDYHCDEGEVCVDGACVAEDQPPVFLSEPLWVGPWMGLSSDPANPHKPQSKHILFWAFNDDKKSCTGGAGLSWMYRPVALQEGVVVALGDWVVKAPWRYLWFAWIETPGIADIPTSPGLFEFKMTATDCLDQEIDSEGFWGKRYYFQVD